MSLDRGLCVTAAATSHDRCRHQLDVLSLWHVFLPSKKPLNVVVKVKRSVGAESRVAAAMTMTSCGGGRRSTPAAACPLPQVQVSDRGRIGGW